MPFSAEIRGESNEKEGRKSAVGVMVRRRVMAGLHLPELCV